MALIKRKNNDEYKPQLRILEECKGNKILNFLPDLIEKGKEFKYDCIIKFFNNFKVLNLQIMH